MGLKFQNFVTLFTSEAQKQCFLCSKVKLRHLFTESILTENVKMQLHIRGNLNYVLEFATGNESCAELKAKIAEKGGSEDVLLYVAGKPVDYEMPVSSIGDFHVDVTVPLLGGKVHGSLARAGKVKGQTPKVEAEEKKKKKTGRAKRRIQYNRRFVNVVPSFGKKKGPNSNS